MGSRINGTSTPLLGDDGGKSAAGLDSGFAGSPADAAARERQLSQAQWEALRRLACPTLVVRGAASDVFSAETADRMVDEVLAKGRLAIVPRAGGVTPALAAAPVDQEPPVRPPRSPSHRTLPRSA